MRNCSMLCNYTLKLPPIIDPNNRLVYDVFFFLLSSLYCLRTNVCKKCVWFVYELWKRKKRKKIVCVDTLVSFSLHHSNWSIWFELFFYRSHWCDQQQPVKSNPSNAKYSFLTRSVLLFFVVSVEQSLLTIKIIAVASAWICFQSKLVWLLFMVVLFPHRICFN